MRTHTLQSPYKDCRGFVHRAPFRTFSLALHLKYVTFVPKPKFKPSLTLTQSLTLIWD